MEKPPASIHPPDPPQKPGPIISALFPHQKPRRARRKIKKKPMERWFRKFLLYKCCLSIKKIGQSCFYSVLQ
jgi:hypothetical protein